MKGKKSAFKESLSSVPQGRRQVQIGATPGQTMMSMFDVDVTTYVALFLNKNLH